MADEKEGATKQKSSDYFRVDGFKDGELTITFRLKKPDKLSSTGKTYGVGRAFGRLPYHVNGKQLRITANIMIPAEEKAEGTTEITL